MKRVFLLPLMIVLCHISVKAQNPNIGTAGAQFLKIPVGPRATAMAGAFDFLESCRDCGCTIRFVVRGAR